MTLDWLLIDVQGRQREEASPVDIYTRRACLSKPNGAHHRTTQKKAVQKRNAIAVNDR